MIRPSLPGALFLASWALFLPPGAAAQDWPDLSAAARPVGGGGEDAAVVVGIEDYAFVADVPGAGGNGRAWFDYLTETRGTPARSVKLLTGMDATRDEIMDAVHEAAAKAGPGGTLWFVFIGHGAPSKDGKDGLLVAADAQQKAKSLERYSVRRGELLEALAASKAGSIRAVLDACFSGRLEGGGSVAQGLQPLVATTLAGSADPRVVVLTAAKGDQYAGSLPGARRPAFSYLVLGGLRGWARDKAGPVTAGDLNRYAGDALAATLRGRDQTPELMGREDAVVALSAGEKGPSLAALAKATAGEGASQLFQVSALPAVPKASAPKALAGSAAGSLDFREVDVASLKLYEAALEADKGEAPPRDKAARWRELAARPGNFAKTAAERAAEWERFDAERAAAREGRAKAVKARDADWAKLSELLLLTVVSMEDKKRWASQFISAYAESVGVTADMSAALAVWTDLPGLLRKACAAGKGPACWSLGSSYWIGGAGFPRDAAKAAELYRRACGLGFGPGCGDFGSKLEYGYGVKKDEPGAAERYREACGLESGPACASLASLYGSGKGVGRDEGRAAAYYALACEYGDAGGCNNLGYRHEMGQGVEVAPEKAAALYEKACGLGSSEACANTGTMHEYGKGVERSLARAVEFYRKGCDAGNGRGCGCLGFMYQTGRGIVQDQAKATGLFQKACDLGYGNACANLGVNYENGFGVAKSMAKAVEIYRKACDAGHNEGCGNLAVMYSNGSGVAKNLPTAVGLYRRACDLGYGNACVNLGILYANGTGVDKDEAKAFELYEKACEQGLGYGCFNLGILYGNGTGVAKDEAKAAELYRKACDVGYPEACKWVR